MSIKLKSIALFPKEHTSKLRSIGVVDDDQLWGLMLDDHSRNGVISLLEISKEQAKQIVDLLMFINPDRPTAPGAGDFPTGAQKPK